MKGVEELKKLIDEAVDPRKIEKKEAHEFLVELREHIEMHIDVLEEELEDEEDKED